MTSVSDVDVDINAFSSAEKADVKAPDLGQINAAEAPDTVQQQPTLEPDPVPTRWNATACLNPSS